MTSKYLKCDGGCGEVIDRYPVDEEPPRRSSHDRGDGCFHSAVEIRSYATTIGWSHVPAPGYNGGQDYCPKCTPKAAD